jgi:hypothetical protein
MGPGRLERGAPKTHTHTHAHAQRLSSCTPATCTFLENEMAVLGLRRVPFMAPISSTCMRSCRSLTYTTDSVVALACRSARLLAAAAAP